MLVTLWGRGGGAQRLKAACWTKKIKRLLFGICGLTEFGNTDRKDVSFLKTCENKSQICFYRQRQNVHSVFFHLIISKLCPAFSIYQSKVASHVKVATEETSSLSSKNQAIKVHINIYTSIFQVYCWTVVLCVVFHYAVNFRNL